MGQFAACVRGLSRDPHSLTARALGGDGYTTGEHLMFLILDELRIANWQRTKDGSKGRNKPKRVSPLAQQPGLTYGRTDRPPEQVAAYLASIGPPAAT